MKFKFVYLLTVIVKWLYYTWKYSVHLDLEIILLNKISNSDV